MEYISYDKFCVDIQKALQERCGQEVQVKLHKVLKINGVMLRGISIIGKENAAIMPTLYLDKFYMEYKQGRKWEEIISAFLEEYDKAGVENEFNIQFFEEYEELKTHLAYKLIHYEMNMELLTEVPYRKYLDLAIVCYCDIKDKRIGHGSILIRREHLKMWKITEDRLFTDAMQNMPKLYEADFMNMAVMLKKLYDDPADLLSRPLALFVLTNKARINGAASMLYDGQLEKIASFLGQDFYILPSSIHEVIILPKSEGTDEIYLSQMVDEINREQLAREEILSNHAYLYHKDTKELVALPLIPY